MICGKRGLNAFCNNHQPRSARTWDNTFAAGQFYTCSRTGIGFFNPLPDNNILEWPKLKQIADDILKCI